MALKYTPKTERIEFADGDFIEVRGLSVPDIQQLVEVNMETARDLFDQFSGRAENSFTLDDATSLARHLVTTAPAIMAHVIALGADSTDQFDVIKTLPLDVQMAALEKIAKLTFAMQGGAKNFVETVLRISEGVNGLKGELTSPRN